MMGQLERRAEAISRELNSQDSANTLWAYQRVAETCFFSALVLPLASFQVDAFSRTALKNSKTSIRALRALRRSHEEATSIR